MNGEPHWLERTGIICAIALGIWGAHQGCQANKLATLAFETQGLYDLRPYVTIEWSEVPVITNASEGILRYKVANKGRTPARNLRSRKSVVLTKSDEFALRGESDIFTLLYPEQFVWYSTPFGTPPAGVSLYFHSALIYEFSLAQNNDLNNVGTVIRFETLKFDALDSTGYRFSSLGISEKVVYGTISNCMLFFDHPKYTIDSLCSING